MGTTLRLKLKMELTQLSTVVAAPNQVSSELAGESVILNVKTGRYYGLNAVGVSIWDKIQSPKTLQELCDALIAEYDVAPDHCKVEIHELLQDMIAAELIQVSEGVNP